MKPPFATPPLRHTLDHFSRRRRRTRVVPVGKVLVGGDNPIVLQSMTTTDTMDAEKTVAQSVRMVEAGCQIVRITTPTVEDSRNLEAITLSALPRPPISSSLHRLLLTLSPKWPAAWPMICCHRPY